MSVRMGLLALLEAGPSHGYQLKADFEARTGGVWAVNVGQVYTTLDRLHTDGLVEPGDAEAADGRDRRPWHITARGKAALDDWYDHAEVATAPPRDELLVKVLLALGRSHTDALAVVDRNRTEVYRLLQAERRRRSGAAGDDDPTAALAADLMAEAVSARREADLAWLDRCEAALLADRTERAKR